MNKVEVETKARILDDFFKVDQAHLRFEKSDGLMSPLVRRLNFERGDSVAAIMFDPDTSMLTFARQFRYPTYEKGPGWIIELIAGAVDKGETPEAAIRREIVEESGYDPVSIEPVSTFYTTPGGSSERIILYYAEVSERSRVGAGGGVASEAEDIELVQLRLEDALEKMASGQIVDGKTMIGLYWLQNRVKSAAPGTRGK
ncbi:NUDIX domain-containing protein [Paraburkholderia tropica]|uniref:NUDIX domain-containing protein n=1 Tax=Paraburkholderia tropica TaxID=92647 RepID=UPI002AB19BD6|nr:NUDIX domain-containing protein [Paraburkholderia tropica]